MESVLAETFVETFWNIKRPATNANTPGINNVNTMSCKSIDLSLFSSALVACFSLYCSILLNWLSKAFAYGSYVVPPSWLVRVSDSTPSALASLVVCSSSYMFMDGAALPANVLEASTTWRPLASEDDDGRTIRRCCSRCFVWLLLILSLSIWNSPSKKSNSLRLWFAAENKCCWLRLWWNCTNARLADALKNGGPIRYEETKLDGNDCDNDRITATINNIDDISEPDFMVVSVGCRCYCNVVDSKLIIP